MFIAGSSFLFPKQKTVLNIASANSLVHPALVHPYGTTEDHHEQNGCSPDGEPTSVGTNVAGLNASHK
jgi:hypothetical protein